jgi:hypothetical protein
MAYLFSDCSFCSSTSRKFLYDEYNIILNDVFRMLIMYKKDAENVR